jgi:hypothetical protein
LQGAINAASPGRSPAGAANAAAAPLSVAAALGLKLVRMAQIVHDLRHLTPAARRLGGVFARPKLLAIGCLALLAALGWAYLGLMLAGMERPPALGPGMPVLDTIADRMGLGAWGRATLEALCRPTFGKADGGANAAGGLPEVLSEASLESWRSPSCGAP